MVTMILENVNRHILVQQIAYYINCFAISALERLKTKI